LIAATQTKVEDTDIQRTRGADREGVTILLPWPDAINRIMNAVH
jgi:hypothetical protein